MKKESTIKNIANEVLKCIAGWASAESASLSLASEKGDRNVATKLCGKISGLMDCAVSLAWKPESCVNNIMWMDFDLEVEIDKSESPSDLLFLHGKQRAVQQVVHELQDMIMMSSDNDTVKTQKSADQDDGTKDASVHPPLVECPTENAPHNYPEERRQATDKPAPKKVNSETVLQWAYEWGDNREGVDIPVDDVAKYFWDTGDRSPRAARSACQNFLYLMSKKGAIQYFKEGHHMTTFRLLPGWRDLGKRPSTANKKFKRGVGVIPKHPTVDDLCQENSDEAIKSVIGSLDHEALTEIARETIDAEKEED